jgi:hypothetical protein
MYWGMIVGMLRKMGFILVLLTAGFSMGCGISSLGSDGSRHQTATGVSETGYPGGKPTDPGSSSLGSSTEQKYASPEVIAKDSGETAGMVEKPAEKSGK